MNGQTEQQKVVAKIIAKAWSDEAFKKRLLAEPDKVLAEHGIEAPAGMEMKVVENTDKVSYFVLPTMPAELNDMMVEDRISAQAILNICMNCR